MNVLFSNWRQIGALGMRTVKLINSFFRWAKFAFQNLQVFFNWGLQLAHTVHIPREKEAIMKSRERQKGVFDFDMRGKSEHKISSYVVCNLCL
jgi:hypothetical protein